MSDLYGEFDDSDDMEVRTKGVYGQNKRFHQILEFRRRCAADCLRKKEEKENDQTENDSVQTSSWFELVNGRG